MAYYVNSVSGYGVKNPIIDDYSILKMLMNIPCYFDMVNNYFNKERGIPSAETFKELAEAYIKACNYPTNKYEFYFEVSEYLQEEKGRSEIFHGSPFIYFNFDINSDSERIEGLILKKEEMMNIQNLAENISKITAITTKLPVEFININALIYQ